MERLNDDLLDRWLQAEDDGSETEADAALTALFAALPLAAAPAPGFADRVMRAAAPAMPAISAISVVSAGRQPARIPLRAYVLGLLRALFASPWGRAGVALGLAAAAFGLPAFARLLAPALALLRPAFLAPVVAHALVEASGWVAAGLRFGHWLAGFCRTLLTPFESPAVAVSVGACLLVPALALRLLFELLHRERNWTHANPV